MMESTYPIRIELKFNLLLEEETLIEFNRVWRRFKDRHFKEYVVHTEEGYFKLTHTKTRCYEELEYENPDFKTGKVERVNVIKYFYKVKQINYSEYIKFLSKHRTV